MVEFQKSGLSHVHILLIIEQGYKITTTNHFDNFISAELLDKEEFSLLHNLVVNHMMHGPCGRNNPINLWMKDGQCKSHYPKPFSNKSVQGKDRYPIYKRRNDGKSETICGLKMNNQWVVPYNPYLLTRYNCHNNIEFCERVK